MLSACCTNYLNKENSDNVKVFCRLNHNILPKIKKKIKWLVVECLDVQIEQTRILI